MSAEIQRAWSEQATHPQRSWSGRGQESVSDFTAIRGSRMEKIEFTFNDTDEAVEFFVLEQTKINGSTYILVTDSEEGDAECLILRESGSGEDGDCIYEIVEEDTELKAVSGVFEELLENTDIMM